MNHLLVHNRGHHYGGPKSEIVEAQCLVPFYVSYHIGYFENVSELLPKP